MNRLMIMMALSMMACADSPKSVSTMAVAEEPQCEAQCPAGPAGEVGAQGEVGPMGPAGQDGRDGVDGVDGQPGRDGVDGLPGRDGVDGRDGAQGPQGVQGPQGPQGNDGADAPPMVESGSRLTVVDRTLRGADGSVYRDPRPRFMDGVLHESCQPMLAYDGRTYCVPDNRWMTPYGTRFLGSSCTGDPQMVYFVDHSVGVEGLQFGVFTTDHPGGRTVGYGYLNEVSAYYKSGPSCLRDYEHQYFYLPADSAVDLLVEFTAQ